MELWPYLFTVNKNRNYLLSNEELKDVRQETEITLSQKNYNDQMSKLTALHHYREAMKGKIKQQKISQGMPVETTCIHEEDPEPDIQQEREAKIKQLALTPTHKKIVKHLVNGLSYTEICKKLKISGKTLRNHCLEIKKRNSKIK